MYRVLLIAPKTDLFMAEEEVQAVIRSGLTVTPLIGHVDRRDVVNEVINGKHDILWFATHGTQAGIVLSDGILSAGSLLPLAKDRFRLIVLNTCGSLMIALQLQNEANASVVATISDVPDYEAFQAGALFAVALAAGSTFWDAFTKARPGGNNSYIYLSGGSVEREVVKIRESIADLKRDNERSFQEQQKQIEYIKTEIAGLRSAIDKAPPKINYDRRFLIAILISIAILGLLMVVAIVLLAGGLG